MVRCFAFRAETLSRWDLFVGWCRNPSYERQWLVQKNLCYGWIPALISEFLPPEDQLICKIIVVEHFLWKPRDPTGSYSYLLHPDCIPKRFNFTEPVPTLWWILTGDSMSLSYIRYFVQRQFDFFWGCCLAESSVTNLPCNPIFNLLCFPTILLLFAHLYLVDGCYSNCCPMLSFRKETPSIPFH